MPFIVELSPKQRLASFDRDMHSREWAYVLVDRGRTLCVLSQRLPELQKYLSKHADPLDPPPLSSLYESATAKLRGGYVHRKWRVIRTELPESADEFERQRRGCARSARCAPPSRSGASSPAGTRCARPRGRGGRS